MNCDPYHTIRGNSHKNHALFAITWESSEDIYFLRARHSPIVTHAVRYMTCNKRAHTRNTPFNGQQLQSYFKMLLVLVLYMLPTSAQVGILMRRCSFCRLARPFSPAGATSAIKSESVSSGGARPQPTS